MDLRQLRYFVAVAEELNFGRAAERLLIAGPSLSQQIKVLERDLGVRLFDRDRRSVRLTPAGADLLPLARDLLERAQSLRDRAARIGGSEPVRLGYVDWLPPDLSARTSGAALVHVDAWVAPSHTQAARVADGGLDLAICWIPRAELAERGLRGRLLGADRLHAVGPAPESRRRGETGEAGVVRARETVVPLDDDVTAWSAWNAYAERLAQDTGARTARFHDGGITGPAFFDHVRRLRRPILNSPKGRRTPVPPDLARYAVAEPRVYWPWLLVWRRTETRPAVLDAVQALTADVGDLALDGPGADAWSPRD